MLPRKYVIRIAKNFSLGLFDFSLQLTHTFQCLQKKSQSINSSYSDLTPISPLIHNEMYNI